jgi:hypothetical protein
LNLDALFKTETLAKYVLLIDFISAFDSLSHAWIRYVIRNAGLGDHFCRAVDFLLTDMIAYPLIGAAPVLSKISLLAGVRQGDPLSGPLFILCIEPLIRAVKQFVSSGTLSYADDIAFVTQNEYDLAKVIRLVKSFRTTSGLGMNMSKTKAIEIGNHSNAARTVEGITFTSNFEYLSHSFDVEGIDSKFLAI